MKTSRQLDRDADGEWKSAKRVLAITTLLWAIVPLVLYSIPVPALNLDDLTQKADIIVAADMKSQTEVGEEVQHRNSEDVRCILTNGTLQVSDLLKGQLPARELEVQYCVPEQFIGWGIPRPHTHAVFFLAIRQHRPLGFADPYYPFAISVPGAAIVGDTPIERVIAAINAVLKSAESTKEQKLIAIFFLSCSKNGASTLALRSMLTFPDKEVSLRAAQALLARNDPSGLGPAADALLKDPSMKDTESKNVMAAIAGGLKDPKAIPTLERFLESPNPEARRAAVLALRNTHSGKALNALASRLDDPDPEIRYLAVIGLAEITGQNDWRPSTAEFKENEEKFLKYWKEWAKNAH